MSPALTDALGRLNTTTYDRAGRRQVLTDPLGNQTSYTFDGAGEVTVRQDGRGYRTTYGYDLSGRQTGALYLGGTRVTLAYDANGRTVGMWDVSGITSYTYDPVDRVTRVTQPGNKAITYTFDGVGNRTVMQDPDGGLTTYSYDVASRLSYLLNPFNERTTWQYDRLGRATTMIYGSGQRATYTFDRASNLTRVGNVKSAGTVISTFDYQYDGVGNRTSVLESGGDRVTWTYDPTYQLTREQRCGANAYDVTFTYDQVGNRTLKNAAGALTTYAYNAGDQITSEVLPAGTRTTYTFDANGNTSVVNAANQATTYTWDGENRLTLAVLPDATRHTFTYDATGLRRQSVDGAVTTKLIWDDQNIAKETNAAGTTQATYTQTPDVYGALISQRRDSTTHFAHFDALGSVMELTNTAQTATDVYRYLAFGESLTSSGSTVNPFRFVGRLGYYNDDDLAMQYVRARWYRQGLGRWVTEDPLHHPAGPILALSDGLYAYAGNDPATLADPSGLFIPVLLIWKIGNYVGCAAAAIYSLVLWWKCMARASALGDRMREACNEGQLVYAPTKDNPCPHWHRVSPSDEFCETNHPYAGYGECFGILGPAAEACLRAAVAWLVGKQFPPAPPGSPTWQPDLWDLLKKALGR